MPEVRWPENVDEIIEEFADCFDSMERFELLFEYAKKHPFPLHIDDWTDENMVHGCQSRAHVTCVTDSEGKIRVSGGADAQIVQGLMAISSFVINGQSPEAVAEHDPKYIEAMGLSQILTPSRANGFMNMITKIKKSAQAMLER